MGLKLKFLLNKGGISGSIIHFALLLFSVYCIFNFNTYTVLNKKILGLLILAYSIRLLIINSKDKLYCLIFAIIVYSNLTVVISDCFTDGAASLPVNSLVWQVYRGTFYEIVFLKALLIFFAVLNLYFSSRITANIYNDMKEELDNLSHQNSILFYGSIVILLFGLVTGYNFSRTSGYISNSNTLYEYCTLIFLLAWLYAGKATIRHIILITYAIIYIGQAVVFGDRSAAFPMIIMIIILYFRNLSILKVSLLSIGGIIFANIIAVYRYNYSLYNLGAAYIAKYGVMSITSDTVSQSYYTGVSIAAVKDMLESTWEYFFDFLGGIILGGDFGNANIIALGKKYATNKGGGMIITNFYFWFGFIGVVILAVIIGLIMKKINQNRSRFYTAWKIYLAVSVFRWYLYNSFVFFRGVIFLFPLAYFVYAIVDRLIKKQPLVFPFGKRKA